MKHLPPLSRGPERNGTIMKEEVEDAKMNARNESNKCNGTMNSPNKRRRISHDRSPSLSPGSSPSTGPSGSCPSDDSLGIQLINSQIFMDGIKSSVKITLFAELYSCSDCGEVFYTQHGLENHHSRISLNVTLSCPFCQVQRGFTNRCQLLNHFKSHSVSPSAQSMQDYVSFGQLENLSLTYDYQISIPHRFAAQTTPVATEAKSQDNSTSEENYSPPEVPDANINCTTHLIVNPSLSNMKLAGQKDSLQANGTTTELSYSCSGCKSDFRTLQDFVRHIQIAEASPPSADLFQCVIDNVPHRSLCGLTLHTAMFHKKLSPFLCPDCGTIFQNYDDINDHARNNCAHFAKTIAYKCIRKAGSTSPQQKPDETSHSCSNLFENTSMLFSHLEDHHARVVLQCAGCPNAFTTRNLLLRHLFAAHQISSDDEQLVQQMTKQLTQCLICEVVFYTPDAYGSHFLSKLEDHCRRIIAYRCPTCPEAFEVIENYRNHQCTQESPECGEQISIKCEPTSPSPSPVPVTDLTGGELRTYERQKCTHCGRPVSSKHFEKHERFCSMNPRRVFFCKVCSKSFRGSFEFLNHGRDHLGGGMKICLYCNNQELKRDELLGEHIRLCHISQIANFPHNCSLCQTTLLDRVSTEAHFKGHHYIGTENRFKCATCGLLFSQITELTKHKSIAHGSQNISTAVPIVKKETEAPEIIYWNYKCKFCKVKEFITVQGLKKHVRLHHRDVDYRKITWSEMKRSDLRKTTASAATFQPRQVLIATPKLSHVVANTKIVDKLRSEVPNGLFSAEERNYPIKSDLNARAQDGTFECLKCNQAIFSEPSFFDHVRTAHIWKEEDGEDGGSDSNGGDEMKLKVQAHNCFHWCPECNMEFAAKPSFVKHILFAHPFIKNVSEYLDNIGYGRREKPLLENQCEVCRLKCSTSLDYDSHIRSHGMAFLKLRQQKRAS